MSWTTDTSKAGWLLLGSGEIVPPEEHERRLAALTPQQRALQDRIAAGFAREAQRLRDAADQLESGA